MLFVSTSTTHRALTDSFVSLFSTTSATNAATSTVISSSVSEPTGSSSSQATFPSFNTAPILHSTSSAAPLNSVVSSSKRVTTSPLSSSSRRPSAAGSVAITASAFLDARTSVAVIQSSQTTIASNTTTSFTETLLHTSFSDSSSIDSSQTKVLASGSTTSDDAPSDTSTPTSAATMFASERTPTITHDFMSPSSGATPLTASYSSSIIQTSSPSRIAFTPSTSSSAASNFSHSYTSGGDITSITTSPDTGSTPNSSSQANHKCDSFSMLAQSPISGTAAATSAVSSQPSLVRGLPQPSNTITSSPMNASHPEMRQSESNDGFTSPTPIPVDTTTMSAYQHSSSAGLQSELSTYDPLVRLGNTMQDGGYTIYTTTFISIRTLYTLTTITVSPTLTTSMPYTTETEVFTTTYTVAAQAPTSVITTTIVVPSSKAGDAFRPSTAQIGGIIAGSIGLLAFLVAIIIYLVLRKRRRKFVIVSPNRTPCLESDAEIGEDSDGHDFQRPLTTQILASASDSDSLVLPPSGRLGYDTSRVSSSPSTVSYRHSSHRETINSVNDLTTAYSPTSSVDIINNSNEEQCAESSSYPSAQTESTESLAPMTPGQPADRLPSRLTQSSRNAYEEEIERLRQEVSSQTNRLRYMEQMGLMDSRSPPPSYRSRRSAISQTFGSSLSLPPPLPSLEINH
ncbi:uncharacterized protein EV420DRAFT_1639954 [Desarmillaria tabescens]|uniref:Uncharacterized protein n=1 Tax=Armillaria tabescens TaxID=1929756 RepID=A0AA39N9S9_ARMTA|nr:uncharacterized protein EV420DRAFT_1639954 [Desarmillaria tabescens]KAK0461660.1 hypothetical protein EV420DRAFT_1639954 [Desarmillaria tabescens]